MGWLHEYFVRVAQIPFCAQLPRGILCSSRHPQARDNSGQFRTTHVMLEDRRKRPPNRRLDSWKEIAAYFGRDERTVKRWEKERGLPIRRLPGARGGVYAFTDDLAHWMEARNSIGSDMSPASFPVAPQQAAEVPDPVTAGVVESATNAERVADPTRLPVKSESGAMLPVRRGWLFAASVLAAAVLATGLFAILNRKNALASGSALTTSAPKVAKVRQPNPKAEDLYLQGRYYWNKRTPADLNKALAYFQQAIAVDSQYAEAYVGLADCYNLLREYAVMPESEAYPKAIAAARKAIELDDSLADAHNSLAFGTFYWLFDVQAAEREFRRALSLNPDCALAHHWYATFLMTIDRSQEALEQIDIAQKLDSSSTSTIADKGIILYHAGRVDEATTLLQQLSQTDPSFQSTHRYLAIIYFSEQKYPEYFVEEKQAAVLSKNEVELAILDAGAQGYRTAGYESMLEAILREQKRYYEEGRISAYRLAETYSLLGRQHEAMTYLRIAHDRRDSLLSGLLVDFPLMKLHDDPTYRELISQIGLPPLQGT